MRLDPRILHAHKLFYRVPFLVPCWGAEELAAVRRSSLRPVTLETSARELQVALRREGYERVVLTSTGRFAIEVALRSLGARGGEVIMPAFGCRSVARAVVEAGCRPVFADIREDLTISVDSVTKNLTRKTIAVLVAHLSGKPATDFDALIALCRERRIALIDDAAQALGVTHRGQPLGTFGDFGILSFGIGKPTFSLGGGALVVRSVEAQSTCEARVASVAADAPGRAAQTVAVANFLLQYHWRRQTLPLFAAARAVKKLLGLRRGDVSRRGRIDPLEAELQVIQLAKLDDILGAFRRNAVRVLNRMGSAAAIMAPQASDDCGYTKLLLRAPGRVGALSAFLLRRGVEVEWSYRPLDADEEFARFARDPSSHARRVWCDLLAVPVHAGLSGFQVDHVASAIAAFSHT